MYFCVFAFHFIFLITYIYLDIKYHLRMYVTIGLMYWCKTKALYHWSSKNENSKYFCNILQHAHTVRFHWIYRNGNNFLYTGYIRLSVSNRKAYVDHIKSSSKMRLDGTLKFDKNLLLLFHSSTNSEAGLWRQINICYLCKLTHFYRISHFSHSTLDGVVQGSSLRWVNSFRIGAL